MLRVHADLKIDLDGQPATLTGSGKRLRFTVERASVLRELMKAAPSGGGASKLDIPAWLAKEGLTLEIADKAGPLAIIGAEAKAGPLTRFTGSKHVAPASYGAAMRLFLGR